MRADAGAAPVALMPRKLICSPAGSGAPGEDTRVAAVVAPLGGIARNVLRCRRVLGQVATGCALRGRARQAHIRRQASAPLGSSLAPPATLHKINDRLRPNRV